ncbi:MAG: SAM-dependent methyltransferase [Gemmatimonadales bacterium]
MTEPLDLYDNVYADFTSGAEGAVRRETYGEDIGQSSWLTAGEWLRFAKGLRITAGSEVLEVGSGSGGPAIYLAERLGCRVTGVDINEHGVRNAVPWPRRGGWASGRASGRWTPAGRCRFRQPASTRSSPTMPCATSSIARAGLELLGVEDVTENAAELSLRWHDARARHRDALVAREGEANFDGLQRFLACVHRVSAERRLSRFSYLARKRPA